MRASMKRRGREFRCEWKITESRGFPWDVKGRMGLETWIGNVPHPQTLPPPVLAKQSPFPSQWGSARLLTATPAPTLVRRPSWILSWMLVWQSNSRFVTLYHSGLLCSQTDETTRHWQYSKSPTYEWVPFRQHVPKSNLFVKSRKVSLGTQITQSAI